MPELYLSIVSLFSRFSLRPSSRPSSLLLASLILLLISLPFAGICEKKKKEKKPREKDYFSLEWDANYSFALGNYAKIDRSTYKSGYAASGWTNRFTFDWLGPRGWGLAIQWALQHNPYQDTAVDIVPYGTKFALGGGGWWNNYVMLGPAFIKPFGKWELNIKAMAGVVVCQSSNFNVMNPVDQSKSNLNGVGWGYSFSAGVGYRVTKHLTVHLDVSYLGGLPKAKKSYGSEYIGMEEIIDPVTGEKYYIPVYSQPVTYEIKRTISTLNVGAGLIYHFK